MSDVDVGALLAALQGASQESEARSPFRGFTSGGNAIGQAVVQGSPGRGTSDIIKSAIVGGLISGVGSNLTDRYVADQNQKAQDVLYGGIEGRKVSRPAGMSPSVFNSLQKTSSVFGLGQQIHREARKDSADLQLRNSILAKGADNPYKAKQAQKLLQDFFGGGGQQPQVTGRGEASSETPASQGEAAPLGTQGQRKTYYDYLEQFQGNESAAEAALKRDLEKPDRDAEGLTDLRKEFQALPEIRAFTTSDIGIRSLREAIKDPAATSDLELVRGAIQAIEPGMAVREGEAAAAQNSASIPDSYKAWLAKALKGESGLPEDVRQGILRIAERRYLGYAEKFNAARTFYQNRAEQRGLDPNGITYLPEANAGSGGSSTNSSQNLAPLSPQPQAGPVPSASRGSGSTVAQEGDVVTGPDGKRYIVRDNKLEVME